ncbi:MAG TPA: family 2A encapsulin nanocompartment cargo protein cysteine desulfurase [Actinocrinis sp.]|nr:family 2A encapsulin nanocompartment cargo protein cysteine desulfurase [Actinocrinis sp.]
MRPPTDSSAPAWLPDEATLNRLAGEFFRALPGQSVDLPSPDFAGPGPDESGWSSAPASAGMPAAHAPGAYAPAAHAPGAQSPAGHAPAGPASLGPLPTGSQPAGHVPQSPATPTTAGPTLPPLPAQAPAAIPVGPEHYYFLAEMPGFAKTAPQTPAVGRTSPPVFTQPPVLPQPLIPPLPPLPAQPSPHLPSTPADGPARYYFVDEPEVPAVPVGSSFTAGPAFDVWAVRRDFPILAERVHGRPLIWLDNAATTQKPQAVLDRLVQFYSHENSNIHRAAHDLAARATDAYEGARTTVARFIGAGSAEEIVFVRGTTEAINLVAKAWGPANVGPGDEIVISHLEHHANIVPWQMLAEQTGAKIKVIPVDEDGQILLDEYAALLSDRTKLVAVSQMSNALGTIVPVEQVIEMGHRVGARVLVDAAQSVPHLPINVTALDADFLVFSGHKLFGPTGIGVLYGKKSVLADMPPWEGGGNMIADVTLERAVYQPPPGRFEAGTGNIADAVGLAAAIDYVEHLGLPAIAAYEHSLLEHATEGLRGVPGLRLVGTAAHKASIVSFVLDGYQPAEVGTALNEDGIAVRSGHHCAQPILRRYGLEATVRPSFAFYNTHDEVDTLITSVRRLSDRRRTR